MFKRIATAAFLLAALALILSTQRTASLTEPTGRLACALSRATLLLFVSRHPITISRPNAELIELATTAWHGSFAAGDLRPAWPKYRTYGANSLKVLLVPLSSLLIAIALVSAGLWLYDLRRPRRGICPQCDYNLTGNTSGICPECGHPTAQPT